jgi:hypothetical protein
MRRCSSGLAPSRQPTARSHERGYRASTWPNPRARGLAVDGGVSARLEPGGPGEIQARRRNHVRKNVSGPAGHPRLSPRSCRFSRGRFRELGCRKLFLAIAIVSGIGAKCSWTKSKPLPDNRRYFFENRDPSFDSRDTPSDTVILLPTIVISVAAFLLDARYRGFFALFWWW